MTGHRVRMAGVAAALGAVAVLGATTFASGPSITDAGPAEHEGGRHHAARQALAAVAAGHGGAGLDRAREPVGADELVRVLQRRADDPRAGRRPGHRPQRRGDQERARQEHVPRASRASTAPTRSTTTARTSSTRDTSSTRPRATTSRASTSTPTRPTASRSSRRPRRTAVAMPEIDGSTWDPFAQRLLFTHRGR